MRSSACLSDKGTTCQFSPVGDDGNIVGPVDDGNIVGPVDDGNIVGPVDNGNIVAPFSGHPQLPPCLFSGLCERCPKSLKSCSQLFLT